MTEGTVAAAGDALTTGRCILCSMSRLGVMFLAMVLLGCSSSATVAVNNMRAQPLLVRMIGGGTSEAWLVPAGQQGIGPTLNAEDRPFVLISTLDCEEVARFAPSAGSQTIVVLSSDAAPQLSDGIAAGLGPLARIADPCPLS